MGKRIIRKQIPSLVLPLRGFLTAGNALSSSPLDSEVVIQELGVLSLPGLKCPRS